MTKFDIESSLAAERYSIQQIDSGVMLFSLGDPCKNFVFVKEGSIRVELLSLGGQQLLLYRLGAGQSCVLTTASLLSGDVYTAQAITETAVELVLITRQNFQSVLEESTKFREFVFHGFAERLSAVMKRVAELSAQSVDQRLVAALLSHASEKSGQKVVTLTHEQLAIEIGSAREVVSRRLAAFEKSGLLVRRRGAIELQDTDELSKKLNV